MQKKLNLYLISLRLDSSAVVNLPSNDVKQFLIQTMLKYTSGYNWPVNDKRPRLKVTLLDQTRLPNAPASSRDFVILWNFSIRGKMLY